MFLPKAVSVSVICDYDDPNRRLVNFSVCNGGSVGTATIDTSILELKELGRRLEEFSISVDRLPLLESKGHVPSQPKQAHAYNVHECVEVTREFANKVLLSVDKKKSFESGAALAESVDLAMTPETLRALGKRILVWVESGAQERLLSYLSKSGSDWVSNFLNI